MQRISLLLVLAMVLSICAGCQVDPPATSHSTQTQPTNTQTTEKLPETTVLPVDYAQSTVILYTANVRGEVEAYSAIVAAKERYEALGATVYLVDAGNYLQGTAYANGDMGLTIYRLMEEAGYAVAGMGVYELAHGEAEVGYVDHGDLEKFYTQAQLYRGAKTLAYQKNAPWEKEAVMAIRDAIAPADFTVICSNLSAEEASNDYYAFDTNAVLGETLKVGFVCGMPKDAMDYVQYGFLGGYRYQDIKVPACDVLVALGSAEGDIVIDAPTNGQLQAGAYVIDHRNGAISQEKVDLDARSDRMDQLIASLETPEVIGVSGSVYNGSMLHNWNSQTNLGTLAADALKWYAETYFSGLQHPVIAIQSGGNCSNFLYNGEITMTDLRNAFHGSAYGVGVVYMTGAQILETLEAATQRENCPGWAQVSGISYMVDTTKAYDWGASYGRYYKAASIRRVSITTESFDPAATYAVVADMLLLRGSETYYVFPECKIVARTEKGLDIAQIVALYIQQSLGGSLA
jgi:hypothetical protein